MIGSLEAILAPGIALYDVVQQLPRGRGRYRHRPASAIRRIYVHHSGADNARINGYEALHVSAVYSTGVRNWPGCGYHYWVSRDPDRDALSRLIVYRANYDATRSYHTGLAANGHGVGVALEGDTTRQGMTGRQERCLGALVSWLIARHSLELPTGLSGHWEAWRYGGKPKRSCPGRAAQAWVETRRSRAA